ncbi:MAG: electron transport complex subunit RsxE, partial [Lachnospiraceae bacterium]|nr:electron transport complex subunit RsxE [Lachnospiraceae bacterium]
MNKCTERLYNGIVKENPTFVQMLGMCPTLAVTTSAVNGMGMGLTTTVILVMSNLMISLLRKLIPNRVRIPAFIIVIASFVTIVQFLLEGFIPSLYDSLGIFIPLIVVNCIILGRAEAYASKNPVLPSVFDGIGMGLGFTVGLTAIGAFRELLGNGTVFNFKVMPGGYQPITIFILAPGAFFVLAFLIAFQNKMALNKAAKTGTPYEICRDADCSHCTNTMCGGRFFDFGTKEGESADVERETTEYAAAEAGTANEMSDSESEPDQTLPTSEIAAQWSAAESSEAFEAKEDTERQRAGENIGGEVLKQESSDGGSEPEAPPLAEEGQPEVSPSAGEGQPEPPLAPGEDNPDGETKQVNIETPEEETEQPKAEIPEEETEQSEAEAH